ncbi:unnamed protein product [Arctia plantaginis]|uniref:Uncharacterized protein n=1 Tax=Arctia plantaginis TaxID=874455 RepID=A0A8S1A2K2_ARCPL|nr:unnamed protein product [Arctia plantaginis]
MVASRFIVLNRHLNNFGGIILRKKFYLDGVNAVLSRGTERAQLSPRRYWRRPTGGAALRRIDKSAKGARRPGTGGCDGNSQPARL